MSLHLWIIPLLPLAGAAINGLLGKRFPKALVNAIALGSTALSFAYAVWVAVQFLGLPADQIPHIERYATWMTAGTFSAEYGIYLDQLSLVMLLIVTGVGFLIHIYSVGYMEHEGGYYRYFAYLNLFMFFMLTLILANNYLLLFVGWEGVGLSSYLLVGFWFLKDSAANAGKKAFITNRVGDFGFLIALFLLIKHFGNLQYERVFTAVSPYPVEATAGLLTAIGLLLLVGAIGKSAQIPLYVWLPDAMEGPTPVSALIHAATMVTAGVYMLERSNPIFNRAPIALTAVAVIGTLTAIFAASIGILQTDIKKVLAYSTISQLGYMFMGVGVAAYSAGIFHLMTHAFFKGLLFLCAGSIIHGIGGEQDMRHMGGLRKYMPYTFWCMTIATFTIAGFPPFAAFFSKDEILWKTWASGNRGLWLIGVIAAGMTSFYMFRLWFLTFFGEYRGAQAEASGHGNHRHGAPHESPMVMLIPLMILAVLSFIGGWVGIPTVFGGSDRFDHFLDPVFHSTAEAPTTARETGTVKWFNEAKGYGFIQRSTGEDVFVDSSALEDGHRSLSGGEAVKFDVIKGPKGIRAAHVVRAAAVGASEQGNTGAELLFIGISVAAAVIGFLGAWYLYYKRPDLPAQLAKSAGGLYTFVLDKYRIDEFYGAAIIQPIVLISTNILWKGIDATLIDGAVDESAAGAKDISDGLRHMQSGNIRSYAGWVAFGAAIVIAFMVWKGVR